MISTHILDTSRGNPAKGIKLTLQKKEKDGWQDVATGTTNSDGRFSFEGETNAGVYQILFEVEGYFKGISRSDFYTQIPVVFTVEDTKKKYHIPLLLNPFGYSTYRGT